MAKKKSKNSNVMAYDLFERDYEQAIEWRTEQLVTDDQEPGAWDRAYEQAIEEVAAENGITLI